MDCKRYCAFCLHWDQMRGIKALEGWGLCRNMPADNLYGYERREGDAQPCEAFISNVPPSLKCENWTVNIAEAIASDGKPMWLGWRKTRNGFRLAISRDRFATWNLYAYPFIGMSEWQRLQR